MKTFKQFLLEENLPMEWKKILLSSKNSFKDRLKVILNYAYKLGTGSSRVAFLINFENRPAVLKIAKNKKGLAQNEAEKQFLYDYVLKTYNITIPIIDFDEDHSDPHWLLTEYADPITEKQFEDFYGLPPFKFLNSVAEYFKNGTGLLAKQFSNEDNSLLNDFLDFYGNYHQIIDFRDFSQIKNWGMYKGHPVIVDIGFSTDVKKTFYSKSFRL